MSDPSSDGAPEGKVDESTLVPMERDRRFLVRLVSMLIIGLIVAVWLSAKMVNAAGACGAGLIRPGSSVIPPEHSAPR